MMHKISKSSILGPSAKEISANWGSQLNPSYSSPASAAAQSLQSRPTLCDPTDGSPPGSPGPGILQARTLEWAAIAFSNAWKWKVKVKLLSRVQPSATPWTAAFQAPPSMGFSRQEYWSGVPLPSPNTGYRSLHINRNEIFAEWVKRMRWSWWFWARW